MLFVARDRLLRRRVSLRVNFFSDHPTRAWFLREAEALAQFDHPAIRHVYDVGIVAELAYRVGNWVEGESLAEAMQRGPRLIPDVMALARDLLGALEHAHVRGIVMRRVVPASVILTQAGRAIVTDVRFCSWSLPAIPPDTPPGGLAYMAPEVRDGAAGDPASDVYTAGALLYAALTGEEPPEAAGAVRPPTALRANTPRALERIILRALQREPDARFLTAGEMLEDLASDAGMFEAPQTALVPHLGSEPADPRFFEKRLRRALGDDYELLGFLGQGGFGRVYRVRDLHLEREVALKVMHPWLTEEPTVVERFRREAQLAGRVTHPNIVNIYDIGGRNGLLWYTMEYVTGPSVAQLVERMGPLSVVTVLRLLREALAALELAHGAGLVHRDLKPENMMLEADGSLRITDFGLALALRGAAGKHGGATSQSGTPQFASPEQLLGERVDPRTDLYSLAAVAWFGLAGHPPFTGRTVEAILARQTTDRLPLLGAVRGDVPPALEAALTRALRSDPAQRFAHAAEFRVAVDGVSVRPLPL
ncbi:MAG: serine/threonine-protein kinase [Gemmatimonadales bacterium]|nr:serine/threonine-protein kinase [Gemmatimonadales bacterium]